MMATLLSLAGFLVYVVCMTAPSFLVLKARRSFPSALEEEICFIVFLIAIFLPLALKNFPWLALISEFPSSFSQMIATLLGLAGYLVCMTGLSLLVFFTAGGVAYAARPRSEKVAPDWVLTIVFGVAVVVTDMCMEHGSDTKIMVLLLFLACYLVYIVCTVVLSCLVFDAVILPVLPVLPPVVLKYEKSAPTIIAGVILLLNGMKGVTPVDKPAFISEFLSTLPFSVSDTLPGYLVYIACMAALSFLVLIIAAGAICKIRMLWPMERPELMLTTVVGLAFMLLNLMWGTPFERPSTDSDITEALAGLAGYLVYVLCSVALSALLSKSMVDTSVISLTFVLLDMFSVSDMIAALAGLVRMIATSLVTLFFLVALLSMVCMGIYTWVSILLPSAAGSNYHELTFATIIGLSYKAIKTSLDTPAVLGIAELVISYLTVFSDMKAALLGIAELISNYQVAYSVVTYLTVSAYIEITKNIRYLR